MKKHQVTIKDIAKLLNVSPSTVSRALKDHPDISEATRIKVQELAADLNYKPNIIARSLRERRSNIIGVIIPKIVHHFFSSVIGGIQEYALSKGYNTIFTQSEELLSREIENVKTLLSSRVDGIIISLTKETENYDHLHNIEEAGVPIVFFDRAAKGIQADKVIIDDFDAAKKATEHLIKNGGTKFLHFSGPDNLDITEKRKNGFLHALNNYKISDNNIQIIKSDNFREGKENMHKIIRSGNIPDAVFTVNDLTAAGALSAINEAGLKVPQDILLMGFTNEMISSISNPPISSVEQNGFDMGHKAAELLINRIISESDTEYITNIIPTELVIRKSSQASER
jgi:LacI family transcriptional regulator